MAVYQSIHTGAEIDDGVTKGTSAVQPDTEASLLTLTLGESPDPLTEGQMAWNATDGTIDIGLNGGDIVLQTGQEIMYRVKNQSGSTIPNGTVVMAVGTNGNSGNILVEPAIGNDPQVIQAKMILGVTTEDILTEDEVLDQTGFGYVTHFGKVRGVDTSTFSDGDVLWLDPAVPGGLTATEPAAPNLKVPLAIVINSHQNVGTLAVRVETGNRLNDLHNVEISTQPAENAFLVWDEFLERWSDRQATLNDLENVEYVTPGVGEMAVIELLPSFGFVAALSDGDSFSVVENSYSSGIISANTQSTGDQHALEISVSTFTTFGGNFGTGELFSFEAAAGGLSFAGVSGSDNVTFEAGANSLYYSWSDGVDQYYFEAINQLGVIESNYTLALQNSFGVFAVDPPAAQPDAVENVTKTVTAGTLPTPDGSLTIADAAAPTVQELLEYIVELEAKVQQLVDTMQAFGFTQERIV